MKFKDFTQEEFIEALSDKELDSKSRSFKLRCLIADKVFNKIMGTECPDYEVKEYWNEDAAS